MLLLDVDLPGLNGLGVLRRLAHDGVLQHTRVIMLTVRSAESEILEALELALQWTLAEHALLSQRFRGRKTPLSFVVCARKAAILHGQIWSAHESDVVGLGACDHVAKPFSLPVLLQRIRHTLQM